MGDRLYREYTKFEFNAYKGRGVDLLPLHDKIGWGKRSTRKLERTPLCDGLLFRLARSFTRRVAERLGAGA